jgi:UDP-N-acetylmuramate--alanine ligase
VHLIGVGGIGVSAVARLMLDMGKSVSGSDANKSEITKELQGLGLIFHLGHSEGNLPDDTDLVVYSPAIQEDNPEREKAKRLGIKELSYPEMLGQIGRGKKVIAISGTNGKTTTTALIGLILEAAKLDPLVIVGSKVKSFKEGNLRFGQGEYFVVEACEYRANMLNINPDVLVLTNIEEDHLDYYRDLNHITETFQKFVDQLPAKGFLILNNDDEVSREKIKPKGKVATYGIKNKSAIMAHGIKVESEKQYFDLLCDGEKIDETFSLQVPGIFNIYNALAATACALELGIDPEIIRETLANFTGTWRRFEKVGERDGAIIFSDYAHHPTAVAGTIRAAKEFYPDRRVVAVFEPHQHNRTKKLFKEFTRSFDLASLVILSEIYEVAGREAKEDQDVSSEDLVREIGKRGVTAIYGKNLEETKKLILENIKKGDVVLIMGAGDIYKIADEIAK